MSVPPTKNKPEDAPVSEFLSQLVHELAAYRREMKLYPGDHPRVQERLEKLASSLHDFLAAQSTLVLEVEGDTLKAQGEQLIEGRGEGELFDILRERLVRKLVLRQGITKSTLQRLVLFLLEDTVAETVPSFGRHAELEQFERFFEASTQESIVDFLSNATGSAPTSWDSFSSSQLESIRDVVHSNKVTSMIEGIPADIVPEGESIDIISNFFELLRGNSRTNWQDTQNITAKLESALDLVREAKRQKDETGGINSGLIADPDEEGLSPHMRWRLLRSFFPDEVGDSPRDAEDLSFTSARGDWSLEEPGHDDWGQTLPSEMRSVFAEGLEMLTILTEFVFTNFSLLERRLQAGGATASFDPGDFLENSRRHLRAILDAQEDPAPLLEHLLMVARNLDAGAHGRYVVVLLREVPPTSIFKLLAKDDETLETLLTSPPDLQEEIETGPACWEREVLRQLLARQDVYALGVVQGIIFEDDVNIDAKFAWLTFFESMVKSSRSVGAWLRENAEELFDPKKILNLLCVPFDALKEELRQHLDNLSEARRGNFFEAFKKTASPQARKFLQLGLDYSTPRVRRTVIEGLAFQRDQSSLEVLERLLENLQFPEEAEWICTSLAQRAGNEGRLFLEHVQVERRGILHRWCRATRKAARRALKQSEGK